MTIGNIHNKSLIRGNIVGMHKKLIAAQNTINHGEVEETHLPRGLDMTADMGGCAFWRMVWPSLLANAYKKLAISTTSVMCFDHNWIGDNDAIRIQRQLTPHHLEYAKFLRKTCDKSNTRLIYEIDDLIFHEDIPDYNEFKMHFTDPKLKQGAMEIISMCDEMTVTCDYMKEYYQDKTGHKQINVIPNKVTKMWIPEPDHRDVMANFDAHKRKPRILYPGSGAHFDVLKRNKGLDDTTHVIDDIISTRKQFKWIFFGGYPEKAAPYIRSGEIEYVKWNDLLSYPSLVKSLSPNLIVAPLMDNTFNRAKSNIKFVEACAFGIPAVCQDLCTYAEAHHKFTTGPELIDQIKKITKSRNSYNRAAKLAQNYIKNNWLENEENINRYVELYKYPFNDQRRQLLNV